MRPIMVTPLLWKRFSRAIHRREEGQALVLMAVVGLALIGTIGLAVDGASAFAQTYKLQQAADEAALAGSSGYPTKPRWRMRGGCKRYKGPGLILPTVTRNF